MSSFSVSDTEQITSWSAPTAVDFNGKEIIALPGTQKATT